MKIKIEITLTEIAELVKEKFNISGDNIDIEIVKPESTESEWITVPGDWSKFYSPNGEGENTVIEAKYRDGKIEIGTVRQLGAKWRQDGTEYVVAYRILK